MPGVAHEPAPVQCETGVYVAPMHDAVPQATLALACSQAPAPLQLPVLPQGGLGAHRFAVSGVPAGMFAHLPALPVMLHDWQSAHDMVLQQTPSTQ